MSALYDPDTGYIWATGVKPFGLWGQPRLMLTALIKRPGEFVSADDLRDAIWTNPPKAWAGILRVTMCNLRKHIDPLNGRIVMKSGNGYAVHGVSIHRIRPMQRETWHRICGALCSAPDLLAAFQAQVGHE